MDADDYSAHYDYSNDDNCLMRPCPHRGPNTYCALSEVRVTVERCQHCQADTTGLFRGGLEAHKKLRELYQRTGSKFPCVKAPTLDVDVEFCAFCKGSPAAKQMLAQQRQSGERLHVNCIHQGEQVGVTQETCCGGKKKEVPLYACGLHETTHRNQCRECEDYEPRTVQEQCPEEEKPVAKKKPKAPSLSRGRRPKPEISLIIVSLEEPEETARTVQSALDSTETPIEVIVMDDASEKPMAQPTDPRVRLIIPDANRGLGVNKNIGAGLAKGDTFVMTDCHMRFGPGCLDGIHRQAQELQGIVQPMSTGYADAMGTKRSKAWLWAAYLYYNPAGFTPVRGKAPPGKKQGKALSVAGINNSWRSRNDLCPLYGIDCASRSPCWFSHKTPGPDDTRCPKEHPRTETHQVPAMLGACYAFRREDWATIDGAWNTFAQWGFLEQQWALKAMMTGVPVYLDPRLYAQHKYWASKSKQRLWTCECGAAEMSDTEEPEFLCEKCGLPMDVEPGFVRPFHTPGNPWLRNAIGCLYSAFGQEAWEREVMAAVKAAGPGGYPEKFAALDKGLLDKRRALLAPRKVITDDALLDVLRVRDHQSAERQRDKDAWKAKKASESPQEASEGPVPASQSQGVGSIVSRRGGDTDFEALLTTLVLERKPRRILEWGPGFSTDLFVHLCPQATILSIEHQEKWAAKQAERFNGRAEIVYRGIGPACRYAYWPTTQPQFDLIFVDGRRRNECLLAARECLAPGGVVVLHDANRAAYTLGRGLYDTIAESPDARTAVLVPK